MNIQNVKKIENFSLILAQKYGLKYTISHESVFLKMYSDEIEDIVYTIEFKKHIFQKTLKVTFSNLQSKELSMTVQGYRKNTVLMNDIKEVLKLCHISYRIIKQTGRFA
ncbi:MAG: hypothetical protein ACMXYA_02135 [Candidatus Woesearchaeota archaeon]